MGSVATNESVHLNTYVSDFYCIIDLNGKNGELNFDAVADAPCEWTLRTEITAWNRCSILISKDSWNKRSSTKSEQLIPRKHSPLNSV